MDSSLEYKEHFGQVYAMSYAQLRANDSKNSESKISCESISKIPFEKNPIE